MRTLRQIILWMAVGLGAIGVLTPTHISAQDLPTLDIRAGWDGYYRVGGWLPITIIAANQGGDVNGEIRVKTGGNWNNADVVYTQPAILPTQSRKQFSLFVFIPNYTQEITVSLIQKNRALIEQQVRLQPLSDQDFLIGVIGDDGAALNYLAGLPPVGKGRFNVAHLSLSDIPAQGRALNGLDALILHRADTAPLTADQRTALRGWVAFGGHLIICGGPNAMATAAGLDDLLPVRVIGTQSISDLSAIGTFANTPLTSELPVVVAQIEPTTGRVLAGSVQQPLIVRRELDRGRLDYLAFDPYQEPLRAWVGNDKLWPRLFYAVPLTLRPGRAQIAWGSLDQAIANIPGLDAPSVLLVMMFLFFYIMIIGPLNLLVLRAIDRQSWAWITIPLLIVIFSCGAYISGWLFRGTRPEISQVTVIRAMPQSSMAAVDHFVGLYSPLRQGYDVRLPDHTLVYQLATSGTGSVGALTGALRVEQGPPTRVRNLEVNVGSMSGFAVHTLRPWSGVSASLTLSQVSNNLFRVQGSLSNQSGYNLTRCVLVLNKYPVQIDDLPNGATQTISLDISVAGGNPLYQLGNDLAGPSTLGREGREQERRKEIANRLFPPYSAQSASITLDGLNLVGWLDASPDQIVVEGKNTGLYATTLLVMPLSFTWISPSSSSNAWSVPTGLMTWQVLDGDENASPQNLYPFQTPVTFAFYIPDADHVTLTELNLHLTSSYASSTTTRPTIQIRRADTDQWESIGLVWGSNVLLNPPSWVQSDGSIQVRVMTISGNNPISLDFSAAGQKK